MNTRRHSHLLLMRPVRSSAARKRRRDTLLVLLVLAFGFIIYSLICFYDPNR
jgi:hypothetical protein